MKQEKKKSFWARTLRADFADEPKSAVAEMTKAAALSRVMEMKSAPSAEEIRAINSIVPKACPNCGGQTFIGWGHLRSGIKRYLCKNEGCGKPFNPLTGTIFDGRKIPISTYAMFLLSIAKYESLRQASYFCGIAETTGQHWISKTFLVLNASQNGIVLSGVVYIDETYFKETPSGLVCVEGRQPKGLSRNLYCVATARDESGETMVVYCGRGKPSGDRILSIFRGHIAPGSLLVHDGENAHNALIRELSLSSEIHTSTETKGLKDSDNPMDRINAVHRFLKKFMEAHGGYARDQIQGWMDLFRMVFMSFGRYRIFVNRTIGMALNVHVALTYREKFCKKSKI